MQSKNIIEDFEWIPAIYVVFIIIIIISVLPKGRSFTAISGTKAAVLPKGRSSTANSGTKVAVLLGMNRCGSFPLLFAPYSLFSIWTDLKRSQEPQRGGEESRIVDQIRDPEIPITLCKILFFLNTIYFIWRFALHMLFNHGGIKFFYQCENIKSSSSGRGSSSSSRFGFYDTLNILGQ